MNKKQVFISSTAYDLGDVRAEVADALTQWGYEPIWNESPDFPKKAGCHSHDICLDAVKNCDIFLLIIDKRYGSEYEGADPVKKNRSITQCEAELAMSERKPMLGYVRDTVWGELPIYKKNVEDGNKYSPVNVEDIRVFEFIDLVNKKKTDNWLERFHDPIDLKNNLKKWIEQIEKEVGRYLPPSLHFQTSRQPDFVGRTKELAEITAWYKSQGVRIGALVAWGGEGKSAIARRWYDEMQNNAVRPDRVFWWNLYKRPDLNGFIDALYKYLGGDLALTTNTWAKVDGIKDMLQNVECLLVLDGLEVMQNNTRDNDFGKMLNPEFGELLRGIADSRCRGLCLITSRIAPKELEPYKDHSFKELHIEGLEPPAARELLRKKGVTASDEEMNLLIENFKGHALSIYSVGEYVKRYYDGQIVCVLDLKYVIVDEASRFEAIKHLFERYEKSMTEAERAFLMLFSLFRTDVTKREFIGFFRKKITTSKLNRKLTNISMNDFTDVVDGLVNWGLIACDESTKSYSAHPLVKKYFESLFEDKDRKAYHKAIYEHIDTYAKNLPDTIEEMKPLFEMVYHGCKAMMYHDVCMQIYRDRINRGNEFYLTKKLGAWETKFGCVRNFFPDGDITKPPLVTNWRIQSWLMNEAALILQVTGRPSVAVALLIKKTNMQIEYGDWVNASVGYLNLSDLDYRTGRLADSLASANLSIEYSSKVEYKQNQAQSIAYRANAESLMGDIEAAERDFKCVDNLQRIIHSDRNALYSNRGIWYAEFLIAIGDGQTARKITELNLEICNGELINDVSCCHRVLSTLDRMDGLHDEAAGHITEAIRLARQIGVPYLEIEALIERGRLNLAKSEFPAAIIDSDAVIKHVDRTTFELYRPDGLIIKAHALKAQGHTKEAREAAQSALDLATGMQAYWPAKEARELISTLPA